MLDLILALYLGFLSFLGTTSEGGEATTRAESREPVPPVAYSEIATATARVAAIVDGDTIDVIFPDGWQERVRYIGLDAPEVYGQNGSECFSEASTRANRALVAGEVVLLERDDENRDPYDRLLRYVYVGNVSVNATLLGSGHARILSIPPNTRYAGAYREVAREARSAGRGLWDACE